MDKNETSKEYAIKQYEMLKDAEKEIMASKDPILFKLFFKVSLLYGRRLIRRYYKQTTGNRVK